MEYLVTSDEMKRYDRYTTEKLFIPECVLMERASLGLAEIVISKIHKGDGCFAKPIFICGFGNNGGDGICCARLLKEKGIDSEVIMVGNPDKATKTNTLQQRIYQSFEGDIRILGIKEAADFLAKKKDKSVVIDALFGVGLSRPLSDEYADLIEAVNGYSSCVISVDVPSGMSADTGMIPGPAVMADITVTFGFRKVCHALYPAAGNCGEVHLVQMGITEQSINGDCPIYRKITSVRDYELPKSNSGANKGTYKKLLIIAGSSEVYGAAFLAAKAALATGIGMITIMTHEKNRLVFGQTIPEAIYRFYDDNTTMNELVEMFAVAEKWADGILIGPGIGLGDFGRKLTNLAVCESDKPLIADADSIRIIAADEKLQSHLQNSGDRKVVFTPHLAEFAALAGLSVKEASSGIAIYPKKIAEQLHITINCKDASSVIASWGERNIIINCTGNDGMASGGSGDVLSGITAVLVLQMSNAFEAVAMAAYVHGLAGNAARDKLGRRAMTATNIIDELFGLWEA